MFYRMTLLALACLMPLAAFAAGAAPNAAARTPRPTITIINLNTADAATLARDMDGIGATKARAIVDHRSAKGAFRSVDELALVKGIGSKTLERNRERLTVGSSAAAGTKPSVRAGSPSRASSGASSGASSTGATAGGARTR